jgi:hypothetical protein
MMLRTTHPIAAGMDHAVSKSHQLLSAGKLYEMVRLMPDYCAIPELLEDYMQPHSGAGLWLTVPEFRTYFTMEEHSSPAISGFSAHFTIVTFYALTG